MFLMDEGIVNFLFLVFLLGIIEIELGGSVYSLLVYFVMF